MAEVSVGYCESSSPAENCARQYTGLVMQILVNTKPASVNSVWDSVRMKRGEPTSRNWPQWAGNDFGEATAPYCRGSVRLV